MAFKLAYFELLMGGMVFITRSLNSFFSNFSAHLFLRVFIDRMGTNAFSALAAATVASFWRRLAGLAHRSFLGAERSPFVSVSKLSLSKGKNGPPG